MKILYIAGWGRSGSTILGNILGEYEGFVHIGELSSIWSNGYKRNTPCGCGKLFYGCPFWSAITDQVPCTKEDAQHFFSVLRGEKKDEGYKEKVLSFYRAIEKETQAKVIVDSSKSVKQLELIKALDLPFYIVHLVRDPRAVAFSWLKKRSHEGGEGKRVLMAKRPLWKTAFFWQWANLFLYIKTKGMNVLYVSYESFAKNPKKTIETILSFIEERPKHTPFSRDDEVIIHTHHTIWGNPVRKKEGLVKIIPDEAWKKNLSFWKKFLVMVCSFPGSLFFRQR